MNDLEFILEVKNMNKINNICKDLNIDYSNLIKGRTKKENIEKVADILENEIVRLYSLILLKRRKKYGK